MREILFRGKLKSAGEWAYGNLVVNKQGIYIITPDETVIGKYGQVDPETVGQYTGINDRNGKKIFEGDVVNTPRWIVSYCADTNEGYGMNAGWYLQRDDFEGWMELENHCEHVVLGNIHDNPELVVK